MAAHKQPKQDNEKRVQVMITEQAYEMLTERAKKQTRSVASYVRHHLYQHLGIGE